jgi:GMP synthase-like glutamine amidotransferase
MRLHYIQHVPFENAGNIEAWAKANGHTLTKTVLYYDEAFPEPDDFDLLVVMGGPMNVYEEKDYPFLKREKAFLKDAISKKKRVLGICLGAQLLSDVLGGKVTANANKEIGWFKVKLTADAKKSPVFKNLPQEFMAFHWHGDTFSIPPGGKCMASSEATANQAFEYDNGRVVGLQFHIESTDDGINRLTKNCGDELVPGKFMQKKDDFLHNDAQLKEIYGLLAVFLDGMAKANLR